MVKYIRREIRQLSSEDRETFLTAMELVHRLGDSDGKEAYGSKFVSALFLTRKHLAKITLDGCTPFHGYDVFLTAHEAFTLELEQSLQAIHPAISLPFWDYTLDDALYGEEWITQSPVFASDWFGPVGLRHSNASHVLSGRFSYIPVGTDASAPEHNSYGRITDAVNNNPSEYVTRSSATCGLATASRLPGCTTMRSVFRSKKLAGFRSAVEGNLHASTHVQVSTVPPTHRPVCPLTMRSCLSMPVCVQPKT